MGRRVLATMAEFKNYELAGLVSRTQPDEVAAAGWHASLEELQTSADLLIDFTLPGGTRTAAEWCSSNGVALLSGTTGLTDEDIRALKNAALKVPVLWAPNLSYGIALMAALVRQVTEAMGESANITITDIHHRHKLDAPSGTALALATAVIEGRSEHLEDLHEAGQTENHPGAEKDQMTFSSVREGEIIGEHTVRFTLADEVIEITHKALDRQVFAMGALKAGEWLVGRVPGYYSTRDWLALD
jgi:4-hydroxy-tetrahydrodipicolinate reductase